MVKLNQGLKKYGILLEQTTERELAQIHNMNALQSLDAKKLTEEEKKYVIASLIFLTEKRDETIRTRPCTDARKQQKYMI